MVADLFNTVYRPLVLFLRFFSPGCVRVVVDLFNTVHLTYWSVRVVVAYLTRKCQGLSSLGRVPKYLC